MSLKNSVLLLAIGLSFQTNSFAENTEYELTGLFCSHFENPLHQQDSCLCLEFIDHTTLVGSSYHRGREMRGTESYNYAIVNGKLEVDTTESSGEYLILTIKSERLLVSRLNPKRGPKASLFNKVNAVPESCT